VIADKVNRAGDTMIGDLILNADPVTNLQAATKQYVDAHSSSSTIDPGTPQQTLTTDNTLAVVWNNRDEMVSVLPRPA
jgi:hypothetical protein